MTLAYIDTETTGLDPRIHQPYEVCWWREGMATPVSTFLPHDLTYADPKALEIGGYWDRVPGPHTIHGISPEALAQSLYDVTLVGSNPAFDAAMLTRFIGAPVWHHRMIDVSNVAMVVFDLDAPIGLAETVQRCRDAGYEIPEPDHTAEGDVRATKAAYEALREIGRQR